MTSDTPADIQPAKPATGVRRGWVATIQVLITEEVLPADAEASSVADGTVAAQQVGDALDALRQSGELADWKYVRIGSHTLYATPAFVAEDEAGNIVW